MTASTSTAAISLPAYRIQDATLGVALWVLCAALAALFLAKSGPVGIWSCALLILAGGALLTLRDPLRALAFLPGVALIGPIARLSLGGGAGLHLGDAYLGVMILALLISKGIARPVWLGDHRWTVIAALFFVGLCWLFSTDPVGASLAMVGIGECLFVYLMTLNLVRSTSDARQVIDGWTFGTTISSVLVIVTYARGETLLIGIGEQYASNFGDAALGVTVLFRATFFVASFIFPVAAIVAALLVDVAFPRYRSRMQRLGFFALLLINLVAVALLATATVFVAVGAMVVALIFWLLRARSARRAAIYLGIVGVMAGVAIAAAVQQLLSADQVRLLLGRFSDGTSFRLRLGVWANVISLLLNDARVLFFGIGPDVSVRTHLPLLAKLFTGSGEQQGAVDNGYLYLFLNYGLCVFALVCSIIVRAQFTLTRRLWRTMDPVALVLWLWLSCLWVMSITQALAVSKPVLMFVQVVAMTIALQRARFATGRTPTSR